MNDIVYCCFTCARDYPLIPYHVTAIHRAHPDAIIYYVVDSSESDALSTLLRAYSGVYVVTCDFPRGHNLMGYSAHMGMLQVMQHLSRLHAGANVCKIDTDCYLVGVDWMDGIGSQYNMMGTACLINYYCKGTCYVLSNKGLDLIYKHLTSPDYIDYTARIEDGVMTMACAVESDAGAVRILPPVDTNGHTGISCIFLDSYFQDITPLKGVRGWIDCGDPRYCTNGDNVAKKEQAMKFLSENL